MARQPVSILASFEIVTPMFLGGADQQASVIRASSVKGALAFWWRALNYASFVRKAEEKGFSGQNALNEALKDLQAREQELFGGPQGQGAFLLKVVEGRGKSIVDEGTVLCETGNNVVGPGARYMAGQGLMVAFDGNNAPAGRLVRSCLRAGWCFDVVLVFRQAQRVLIKEEILPALKLFGLVGGLGSRVRRGWGSVALKVLRGDGIDEPSTLPNDESSYKSAINTLLTAQKAKLDPAYGWPVGKDFTLTAFAEESRILIADKRCSTSRGGICQEISPISPAANWTNGLEALDWMGRAFLNYRAWGQGGMVGGQQVQQQFVEDHNWFYGAPPKVDIPYRTAFGLPHNYFKHVPGGDLHGRVNQGKEGRRGSPLLFHIHKVDNKFVGVVTILPTKFVEGNIDAEPANRKAATSGPYFLHSNYGVRTASGDDVLFDFVGRGTSKFNANQLLTFEDVYP